MVISNREAVKNLLRRVHDLATGKVDAESEDESEEAVETSSIDDEELTMYKSIVNDIDPKEIDQYQQEDLQSLVKHMEDNLGVDFELRAIDIDRRSPDSMLNAIREMYNLAYEELRENGEIK